MNGIGNPKRSSSLTTCSVDYSALSTQKSFWYNAIDRTTAMQQTINGYWLIERVVRPMMKPSRANPGRTILV